MQMVMMWHILCFSFGVECIRKEIKKFIVNKNSTTNIFRIQGFDLIMCGYSSIGFIDFMFKGKSLWDYWNLFSPNKYGKNDKIIYNYFKDKCDGRKRKSRL